MRNVISFGVSRHWVRWHSQLAAWTISAAMGNSRWIGYCAFLVIALSAAFVGLKFLPMQEQMQQLRIQIAAASIAMPQVAAKVDRSEAQENRVMDSIADLSDRTVILDGVVDAAAKHNLYLQQAQYHWLEKSPGSSRKDATPARIQQTIYALQWTLPVKGSYRDIREYVGELLETNSSLALESIALNRDGPMGAKLQADLRFTLYLRGSP